MTHSPRRPPGISRHLARFLETAGHLDDAAEFLINAQVAYREGAEIGGAKMGLLTAGHYTTAGGGWRKMVNFLSPRVYEAAAAALPSANRSWEIFRQHMDGFAPEASPDGPPWRDFRRHLDALDWGVVVIFGAKGYGKTQLALKLASNWSQRLGWPVETIGFHAEDQPDWARRISMKRLIARAQKVAAWLDQEDIDESDDGINMADLDKRRKAVAPRRIIEPWEIERLKCRIVIVDEAALFFSSLSDAGQQRSREASRNLDNQARHLKTIFVFICQKLSEMPNYLRTSAIQFYKFASEEMIGEDWRPGSKRHNYERWYEVLSGLAAVKTGRLLEEFPRWMPASIQESIQRAALVHDMYWAPPVDTVKAWAWAITGDIGGHTYRGPFPNTVVPIRRSPSIIDVPLLESGEAEELEEVA